VITAAPTTYRAPIAGPVSYGATSYGSYPATSGVIRSGVISTPAYGGYGGYGGYGLSGSVTYGARYPASSYAQYQSDAPIMEQDPQ